jgi:hypothetical protein
MSEIRLTNLNNSIHTFLSVQSFCVQDHIQFLSSHTSIHNSSNTLYVLNGNITFNNHIHQQLMPNYIYFHNTVSDYVILSNLAASTYVNIFNKNPILLSNQKYCIEFCATIISMDTANNVHSFLRTSGTCGIESMTATYTTAVGSQTNGAMIKSNAVTVTQLSANTQTLVHEGSNNQPNRNVQAHIVLRTNSVGGSFIMQIMEDHGPANPKLLANSGMRILWLGPSGTDLTFGSYV